MIPDELYTKEEAHELWSTYSCWINKAAHVGNGYVDIIKAINIRKKRIRKSLIKDRKMYTVQFIFTHSKKQNAFNFLKNNGLLHSSDTQMQTTPQKPHTPLS